MARALTSGCIGDCNLRSAGTSGTRSELDPVDEVSLLREPRELVRTGMGSLKARSPALGSRPRFVERGITLKLLSDYSQCWTAMNSFCVPLVPPKAKVTGTLSPVPTFGTTILN